MYCISCVISIRFYRPERQPIRASPVYTNRAWLRYTFPMAKEKLTQKNIRFPNSLWERVEAATTDEYTASDFVRDATAEKLDRIEAQERIQRLEQRVKDLESR